MKWLLILFFSLLPFVSISQDTTYINIDTTNVQIDYVFIGFILDEFVDDAINHGLDSSKVVSHIRMLDGIYMRPLDDKLGVTLCKEDSLSPNGLRGAIFIDDNLYMSYSILKLTVYHELGHWFGLDHTNGIMRKNSRKAFKVLYAWNRNVKKLMKEIKRKDYSYPTRDGKYQHHQKNQDNDQD
jgi:hypothetical protein